MSPSQWSDWLLPVLVCRSFSMPMATPTQSSSATQKTVIFTSCSPTASKAKTALGGEQGVNITVYCVAEDDTQKAVIFTSCSPTASKAKTALGAITTSPMTWWISSWVPKET